jgi:hypothetical protein
MRSVFCVEAQRCQIAVKSNQVPMISTHIIRRHDLSTEFVHVQLAILGCTFLAFAGTALLYDVVPSGGTPAD